jgi:Domain of unknown function (DUF4365)
MARQTRGPRKQRTRQHVIADLSANYVERIILEEGHSVESPASDYGYDLVMRTHDSDGFIEAGAVYFQLKSSDNLVHSGGMYSFDLDIRDYNLWRAEVVPVVLILFDAGARRAYWLLIQQYFQENPSLRPQMGAKTIRVHISSGQSVNRRAIQKIRTAKEERLSRVPGGF